MEERNGKGNALLTVRELRTVNRTTSGGEPTYITQQRRSSAECKDAEGRQRAKVGNKERGRKAQRELVNVPCKNNQTVRSVVENAAHPNQTARVQRARVTGRGAGQVNARTNPKG